MSAVTDPAERTRAQQARRKTRGKEIGWARWADGEEHLLTNGKDFVAQSVGSTRLAAQQWARRQGLRASCSVVGEGPEGSFWLQVMDGDPLRGGQPLTPQMKRLAREVQDLEAKGAAPEQIGAALRFAQRVIAGLPPVDEKPGPLARRRARLAKEAVDHPETPANALHAVVTSRKPGAGRRRRV